MQRTKKAICLLLSVLLALSCFTCLASVTAFAADGDTSILYDDVDGDGALTVQDDTHIQRYLTEFIDKFPAEDASEEDTLIVAGSEAESFGTGWDGTNEANQMTKQADGAYTKEYTVDKAYDAVQLKSVKNGAEWIGDETGTFIEISIDQQHMWFYENGNLIVDTPVVTGNDDGDCNTPTGSYAIQSREVQMTLVGEDYESYVDYWLGFNGGIGIHDASWRDDFGGDIYQGNGSHGCVNTPLDKVQVIYERTDFGTPVYVY